MTHVAVELPEEDGVRRYIYIHHLTYAAPPSPYTEMLELWPAWQTQGDWFPGGHVSGRVLCEKRHGAGCRLPHAEERQPTGQRPLRHPPDPADHRRLSSFPAASKAPAPTFSTTPSAARTAGSSRAKPTTSARPPRSTLP